jgi:hypothetical protein
VTPLTALGGLVLGAVIGGISGLVGIGGGAFLKLFWIVFRRVVRFGGSSGCTAGSLSASRFTTSTFTER